jgi:hypothetical protein
VSRFLILIVKSLSNLDLATVVIAEFVNLKIENYNKLLSMQKTISDKLSSQNKVISVNTVQDWINNLVNCVIHGIKTNCDINSQTPTNSNSIQTNANNSSVLILKNSLDSQMNIESDISKIGDPIEERLTKLEVQNNRIEKLVTDLITKQNGRKMFTNKGFNNKKFVNTNQKLRSTDNTIVKSCWICNKSNHLSFECYYNKTNKNFNVNHKSRQHWNQNQNRNSNQYWNSRQDSNANKTRNFIHKKMPTNYSQTEYNGQPFLLIPNPQYTGPPIQTLPATQQYPGQFNQ